MLRRRRRPRAIVSDSSDDDNPPTRKQLRSSIQSQNPQYASNTSMNQFYRRQNVIVENHDASSDSSVEVSPRKRKKLPISTSEEVSSSENEELFHPVRQRAQSDNKTGNKSSGSHTHHSNYVPDHQSRTVNSLVNIPRGEETDSSSDDSIVPSRSFRKRKRPTNRICVTSSSDSDLPPSPIFTRIRQIRRLALNGNRHAEHQANGASTMRAGGTNWRVEDRDRPTASRSNSPVRMQTRWQVRNASQSSNISLRAATAQREEECSSDSDIRPRSLRQHRNTVFYSDSASSNSDSDDNCPIRPVRHSGGRVPLLETDDSDCTVDPFKSVANGKTGNSRKPSCSSDSDGESEKCPICLARFTLQEIGIPKTCDHRFCLSCLQEWAKNNNTCPVDRKTFNAITVRAHVQGQAIREVPVETPKVKEFWGSEEWWENIAADIMFAAEGIQASESDSNEDGPEEVCCVCFQSNYNESMIVCDFCNNVYHMSCVIPPLQYVPATDWFCPECVEAELSLEESSSSS